MVRKWLITLSAAALAAALALPSLAEPKLVAAGDVLLGPAKTPQFILDGGFKAETTKLDTGKPADVFDGDQGTLMRTPSINPAFFQFMFEKPVSFYGLRINDNGSKHEYTVAGAANAEDLLTKQGSYKVIGRGTTDSSGEIVITGKTMMTFSTLRIDLHRVEGDDYIHLSEIEFLEPVKLKSMDVTYKIRTSHGDYEKNIYKPLDETATRPEDSLFIPRVIVTSEDGKAYDATGMAKVSSRSKSAKGWEIKPYLELTKPGMVDVKVEVGSLVKQGTVKVTPRTTENKQPDLDVLYVERLPRLNFDGPNGGWPLDGQKVIWRAHVQNWGEKPVTTGYRWTQDGREVETGRVKIKAGEVVTLDLPWTWEKKRHEIVFEINPDRKTKEFINHNNKVDFASDALAVGFYIDRSVADFYHENQYKIGLDDANSFADYQQREIRHWNKMLRQARYPESPNGIIDRVRVDRIVVAPDQALPYTDTDIPGNYPNLTDKTVDLMWGYADRAGLTEAKIDFEAIKKGIAQQNLGVHGFFLDLALIHELNHARYLIDTYGLDVASRSADPEKSGICIKDDLGRPITGLYLQKEGIVHYDHYEGNMGGPYEIYGPYEAVMMNRIAGQRAQGGNCNCTCDIGSYLQDIPKQFKIKFVGPNGEILANDPVKVYWPRPIEDWYGKAYENTVDREFTTDSEGAITTDKFFFAKDGKIEHTWGHSNAIPIVRIDHEGKTYYIFLEVTEVNMLANTCKDPVPVLTEVVPLRTGEPTPLPVEYGRRKAPDWRLRTQFDIPK